MPGLADRAAALRSAFDQAFATPLRGEVATNVDLLVIRVGAEPCAIRLAEITGLFADRKLTRVPGGNPALRGVAGFRGTLVPVYGLRTLLGQSETEESRWLVVATTAPVAFSFDRFEGHLRAPADAILPRQSQDQLRHHAREFIRTEGVVRPVLHLPSIVEALAAMPAANAKSMQE